MIPVKPTDIADHFETLARCAIQIGIRNPLNLYHAIKDSVGADRYEIRRYELILEWHRRRHEFPWPFPYAVWEVEERLAMLRAIAGRPQPAAPFDTTPPA